MKSRLDALGAEYESDIRRVCGDRAKALDAQEEELTVTEAQLQWASAMAGSAAGPLQPKAQGMRETV